MIRDRWLWGALLVALLLRVLPMVLWPQVECNRDECIYRYLALGIERDGVMGVTTKGWLAAPGYPWLLVLSRRWLGTYVALKWLQIGLSLTSIPVLYAITARVSRLLGDDTTSALSGASRGVPIHAARIAAWLLALHPTLAWFTNTWWIETIYVAFLLPAVLGVLIAREEGRRMAVWAAFAGLCLAICVLFRGVATWLPPLFALALLWPGPEGLKALRADLRRRLLAVGALGFVVVASVAPYSVYASRIYGGFMVSDATVGHVLYLGNNDFPPMTFDYGNGTLTQPLYYQTIRAGRRFCDRNQLPVHSNRCEVREARRWILANPGEFVARIPLRLAQQLNPNTFLTRHIRWGFFRGLPWALKELACLWIAATTAVIVIGGSLVGLARGRGAYAVMAGGTIAYTLFAAAIMYGMSRFRLPLEPLWIVWLAIGLARPGAVVDALQGSRMRAIAVILVVPTLVGLTSWYALTGFPMFWR